MADLSGVCDSHGVAVFHVDDAMAPAGWGAAQPPHFECDLSKGWYWASHQHAVLTGKPNGPYSSRVEALANAVVIMAAHDSNTVLKGSDLGL